MIRDRNDIEELAHDTAGVDPTPFMQAALDDIVESLMAGEKVRGLAWGLQDFLADLEDLPELVSAALTKGNTYMLHATVEHRLRRELADHDAIYDLAAEMAEARDEE